MTEPWSCAATRARAGDRNGQRLPDRDPGGAVRGGLQRGAHPRAGRRGQRDPRIAGLPQRVPPHRGRQRGLARAGPVRPHPRGGRRPDGARGAARRSSRTTGSWSSPWETGGARRSSSWPGSTGGLASRSSEASGAGSCRCSAAEGFRKDGGLLRRAVDKARAPALHRTAYSRNVYSRTAYGLRAERVRRTRRTRTRALRGILPAKGTSRRWQYQFSGRR